MSGAPDGPEPAMLLSCPSCRTEYEIDDDVLPAAGRKARCSSCGAVWHALPDGAEPEIRRTAGTDPDAGAAAGAAGAPAVEPLLGVSPGARPVQPLPESATVAPEDTAATAPPAEPRSRRRRRKTPPRGKGKRRLLLAAGIAAAIAVPALLVHQRDAIVRLAPPAAALFRVVGLSVNTRGIDIVQVRSRQVEEGGMSLLVVEGELVSLSRKTLDVPRLRFAVRDDKGAEIYSWTAPPDSGRLQPGERQTFRRRLASPPAEGREVSVRFVHRQDMLAGLK
jgi:predicted Zn finger-like uncharacterized protein